MQSVFLILSLIVAYAEAICTGSKYWDPLNNACVNCKAIIIQNALGTLRTYTTRIRPPTSV